MMPYPFGATPREEIVAAFREEADAVDHATEEPAWFLPFAFNETDILTLLDLLAAEVARDGDQAAWARASRVAILNRLGIQEVL